MSNNCERKFVMTEIKKSLGSDNATTTATVAATLEFTPRKKLVTLRLEGTILGEHTAALRDFLRNLSYFPGNKWTLELENLAVISMRALKVLVQFAKIVRRRGYDVEIANIQASVLAAFLDSGIHEHFNWEAVERQVQRPKAAPVRAARGALAYESAPYAEEVM
jgi:anti-anti-sigma regulatory factor